MNRVDCCTLPALLCSASISFAQMSVPVAPPRAPEIVAVGASSLPGSGVGSAATAPQLYSIGSPTKEEQLYLELINRARANPAAEGIRLAGTTEADVLSSYTYFGV